MCQATAVLSDVASAQPHDPHDLQEVGDLGWLLPAISKAGVVFDLVEGRIEGSKLVPDALDCGPHIRPITVGPVSSNEAFMAQPVINCTVSYVLTHVRSQQMDDVVFAKGEVEIRVVPIDPADIGTQKQLAADHGSVRPRLIRAIGSLDHALEAPAQNLRAP